MNPAPKIRIGMAHLGRRGLVQIPAGFVLRFNGGSRRLDREEGGTPDRKLFAAAILGTKPATTYLDILSRPSDPPKLRRPTRKALHLFPPRAPLGSAAVAETPVPVVQSCPAKHQPHGLRGRRGPGFRLAPRSVPPCRLLQRDSHQLGGSYRAILLSGGCSHLSERVPVGGRLSLIVSITSSHPTVQAYAAPLKPFTIPPGGTNVTVVVSVPGLRAQGDLEQDLWITLAGNPEPIRFSFVAERIGLHTATVQAYRHGTFLAELHAQVSVDVNADVVEGTPQVAQISALAAEPGEVTLQVSQTDDGRYSFQLLGEALHSPELTRRLAGDPTAVVDEIVAELRSMAAGSSAYSTSSLVRRRLKNLGTQLWQAVVPEAIQRQFWDQVGQIKTFTVASDRDILPWELLYPLNENLDNGFLVDQFPVVRRVYGQGRARGLRVGSAAYVVPPGSPENAHCEVQAIQTRLNGLVVDRGILARLDEMIATLEAMPSLLHFACHNTFSQHSGSSIMLEGGPLRPTDLSVAVQTRSMAAAGPLVFFNACRTAAEAPWLAENLGWAKQFMRAGAGAFVGSLWAVRSSAAQAFAESFYDALVVQGLPLGEASLAARRSTTDQAGDPTRLAYTIYGNPAATAMSRMETP